jgi:hypothetical protein
MYFPPWIMAVVHFSGVKCNRKFTKNQRKKIKKNQYKKTA